MTTIIQLSDCHIVPPGQTAYGRVNPFAGLRRAVARISTLPELIGPIDALIVSGDITDYATAEEYAAFREIMAPLADGGLPIFVMPGNHDARPAMRAAFADHPYLPGGEGPLDYSLAIGDLQVICLDSLAPGQPHGELAPEQLDWLEARLAESAARPTVVFVHHPPFETGIVPMDRINLRNGEALLEVLSGRPQVKLLAAGHVHRMISGVFRGVPCLIAPAPSHAVSLDHRDRPVPTYHMEPGGVLAHCWRAAEGEPFGRLTTSLAPTDPGPGPFPFVPEETPPPAPAGREAWETPPEKL